VPAAAPASAQASGIDPARDLPERWQWTFPIVFDPFDANTLYISSQHVWKTTNDGQSWTKISPDLTRADPMTLGASGGPITRDMNGPEIFATVFAIGPSAVEQGLIWTGSDDGYVFVARDGGGSWANVTPPGLGDYTRVSTVEPSPHKSKAGTAYVAGKRYLVPPGDRQPYLFRTDDYGRTWTKIVDGIAAHHYTHSIREDPVRPGLLFAATEHGVYVSFDDGGRWQSLRLNMPDTQISDLAVKGDDLVVATHGRSFWVLENISTLRQLTPGLTTSALTVFEPRPAIRSYNRADVDYYLGAAVDRITVEPALSGVHGLPRHDHLEREPGERADGRPWRVSRAHHRRRAVADRTARGAEAPAVRARHRRRTAAAVRPGHGDPRSDERRQ
jgi:hypothetical protein